MDDVVGVIRFGYHVGDPARSQLVAIFRVYDDAMQQNFVAGVVDDVGDVLGQ